MNWSIPEMTDDDAWRYWRREFGCGFIATPYFSALALPCGLYMDFLLPF